MVIVGDPVIVREEAGDDRGATGGAQRGGDKRIGEVHAVCGHTIEMRGLEKGVIHVAQSVETLVINEDEDDVALGWLGGGSERGRGESEQED